MTDQNWADFREETFGDAYMVWHDGPVFGDLIERWEADPALVERMLLAGIADDDSLAAQAIGKLPLDAEAKQRFADALSKIPAWGTLEVRTAESLVELTGDQSHASRIAKVLTDPVHWGDRIDAAISLRQYRPTEELIAALEAGLRDSDNLVRHHSAESLLSYAKNPILDISEHDEDFGVLVGDDPNGWVALATKLGDAARRANSLDGHAIDTRRSSNGVHRGVGAVLSVGRNPTLKEERMSDNQTTAVEEIEVEEIEEPVEVDETDEPIEAVVEEIESDDEDDEEEDEEEEDD